MEDFELKTNHFILIAIVLHAFIFVSALLKNDDEVPYIAENITTVVTIETLEKIVLKEEKMPLKQAVKKIVQAQKNEEFKAPIKKEVKQQKKKVAQEQVSSKKEVATTTTKVDPNDLQKYINKVVRTINSRKAYPRLARANGEEDIINIKIVINRLGLIQHYEFTKTSKYPRLNEATKSTIASCRFPPLPESYPNSSLTVVVPVHYRLN